MLMLIHKEECPFCLKVRQFMSDNGISYVSLVSKTSSKSRKILEALGGKSQVPFLIDFDAGEFMYESDGIIEYLKEKCGAKHSDTSSMEGGACKIR